MNVCIFGHVNQGRYSNPNPKWWAGGNNNKFLITAHLSFASLQSINIAHNAYSGRYR